MLRHDPDRHSVMNLHFLLLHLECGQRTSMFAKQGHSLERVQAFQGKGIVIRRIGGKRGIVAGQPTSSVALVTAPPEGDCMQSVPMSSSPGSTSWLGVPPAHMGGPQARLRDSFPLHLLSSAPSFSTESRLLSTHSFTQQTCSLWCLHCIHIYICITFLI